MVQYLLDLPSLRVVLDSQAFLEVLQFREILADHLILSVLMNQVLLRLLGRPLILDYHPYHLSLKDLVGPVVLEGQPRRIPILLCMGPAWFTK